MSRRAPGPDRAQQPPRREELDAMRRRAWRDQGVWCSARGDRDRVGPAGADQGGGQALRAAAGSAADEQAAPQGATRPAGSRRCARRIPRAGSSSATGVVDTLARMRAGRHHRRGDAGRRPRVPAQLHPGAARPAARGGPAAGAGQRPRARAGQRAAGGAQPRAPGAGGPGRARQPRRARAPGTCWAAAGRCGSGRCARAGAAGRCGRSRRRACWWRRWGCWWRTTV